ncbi:hypothetical protein GCM10022254_04470 [Actinomadura meridiana]|uniref:DUF4282 domain-containing protein n=1 Tax=Actinomadura meridiana TaxID=559626 RepID=A0ABP8BSB2_9ACTN
MTHQPDPGHPPRPQVPVHPESVRPEPDSARFYGPPPLPGPRPPGPPGPPPGGPQEQQQGWAPPPRVPARKGVVGTLLDLSFDYMITAKLVKAVYALALVSITLMDLILAWYGLALLVDGSGLGLALLVATPFIWIFQLLVTRLILEFVINQFKISEYLRIIKDKT